MAGFTRHFTHLKTSDTAKDKTLLLTTILTDAINPGLTKMAESFLCNTFRQAVMATRRRITSLLITSIRNGIYLITSSDSSQMMMLY